MKITSIVKSGGLLLVLLVFFGCSEDEQPVDCLSANLQGSVDNIMDAICDLDNGSFDLTISGGTGPFEFSVGSGAFQSIQSGTTKIEGVPSGNQAVTVRDANNCTATANVNISNVNDVALDTEVVASGCETSNGVITLTASGGQEPYTFSLDGGSAQLENIFSGLAVGDYTVLVTDDNGCQNSVTVSVDNGTSYNDDIVPIINTNCAVSGCHDGNSSPPDWTDLALVQENAENIKTRTMDGSMPPPGRQDLQATEIQAIACWVDDGALNN